MSGGEQGQKIDAVVVEMPENATCGVCGGEPFEGGCPQCSDGKGYLPFPLMPSCGTCEATLSMELVGHSEPGRQGMPIYRCDKGHHTAIKFVPVAAASSGGGQSDG